MILRQILGVQDVNYRNSHTIVAYSRGLAKWQARPGQELEITSRTVDFDLKGKKSK